QFWFGYESANAIVLPTGGPWAGSLAQAVANDPARREALEQWVAQGGHLVVAVAANAGPVSNRQSFPLEPLLPATIDPAQTAKVAALSGVSDFINREVPREARQSKEARPKVLTTELARLTPRGSARVLAMEPSQGSPAIVQGTHGLGRVTLLAFDVDFGPIAEWESRYDLWTAVMDYRPPPQGDRAAARAWGGGITEVGEALATGLESFGDVTVVPFFWVAIFILIYIILIGPVDYLFLKKVVKRLELTWITFPTLVLAISVAAYFAAVWLKGDEMRINKVDVVDVDVTRQRCVGTTWFSIFSPKLQTYDLTLRPVGLGELSKDSLVLSWLPRAGWGARGMDRMQSPDLFRRSYTYADNASRLVDVPIQVWAMKSLQGRWQSELDPDQPLVRHTLRESRLLVAGTVTSYLPGPLRGARLVYRDAIWDLGTLEPGKPTALPTAFQELRANSIFVSSEPPRTPSGQLLFNFVSQLNPILFNRVTSRQQAEMTDNTYVDHLDQTGRLAFRQAMLVGVLEDVYGSAAEINAGIKWGPHLDFSRPPLQGVMRQVTVVRLHLELAASEEK
ncbi:MAG TPA: hypothetical protein PKD86_08010, partial [Gemmatales bacterium]|nr:hypothetical protein [Gemmatales bacterium]